MNEHSGLRPPTRVVVFVVVFVVAITVGGTLLSGGVSLGDDSPPPTPLPAGTLLEDADTSDLPGWARQWSDTDFSRRTVNLEEIISGGVPPDGIPPIDHPQYVEPETGDAWFEPQEPVIQVEVDGDVRAYPLQIMTWHEIVNTEIGGESIGVTFCPLCNSAVAFDRGSIDELGEVRLGVSGLLRNSDLVMWDDKTESLWQQITGEAIVGEMAGERLTMIPATIVSWAAFKEAHPYGLVLSVNTGFDRNYGSNPYAGYDNVDQSPFLFQGQTDDRQSPMIRVLGIDHNDDPRAYPFPDLEEHPVVHDEIGGDPVVIFWQPGATSALDQMDIAASRDVGMAAAFNPVVNGQELTFVSEGEEFRDEQTGSTWNIAGEATDGELEGERLEEYVSGAHFWFAWAAFQPDTEIWSPDEES